MDKQATTREEIDAAASRIMEAAESIPLNLFSNHATLTGDFGMVEFAIICHHLAEKAGWWADPETGEKYDIEDNPFIVGTKIGLVHAELSEAIEGFRKGLMDEHLPHRPSIEVELADAVIRIFDIAGALDLDIPGAAIEKLAFNQKRADHKTENRVKQGGKRF